MSMQARTGAALAVAVVVLAGCSGTRPPAPRPAPVVVTTPVAPPSPEFSDVQACAAFSDATLIGIPPGDAPPGTNTMTWLQGQLGPADPSLRAAMTAFTQAWLTSPPNLRKIGHAKRAIKRICLVHG